MRHLAFNKPFKLCLVTNRKERSFDWLASTIDKAARGGITMVQLREKDIILDDEFISFSKLLLAKLKPFKIPLIINDRVDICKLIEAQGVHIGQNDMHPDKARKILGERAIIGLSLENTRHAEAANKLTSIDYVVASPVFPSKTKPDCKEIWGIEGLKTLTSFSKHPVISIGGINLSNIAEIMNAGSKGVAIVSAIQEANDPKKAANDFSRIIRGYHEISR